MQRLGTRFLKIFLGVIFVTLIYQGCYINVTLNSRKLNSKNVVENISKESMSIHLSRQKRQGSNNYQVSAATIDGYPANITVAPVIPTINVETPTAATTTTTTTTPIPIPTQTTTTTTTPIPISTQTTTTTTTPISISTQTTTTTTKAPTTKTTTTTTTTTTNAIQLTNALLSMIQSELEMSKTKILSLEKINRLILSNLNSLNFNSIDIDNDITFMLTFITDISNTAKLISANFLKLQSSLGHAREFKGHYTELIGLNETAKVNGNLNGKIYGGSSFYSWFFGL